MTTRKFSCIFSCYSILTKKLLIPRPGICALTLAVLGLTAMPAKASFSYPDFSSTAGLQLNGNATTVNNALRLTSSTPFEAGSAFTTFPITLGNLNSFSSYFQFQIGNSQGISDLDGPGADGLVFVLQTVSNNVGGAGGGIGYAGISPSVGIEFDTYDNGIGNGDPNGNHVGIDINGNIASVATALEPVRFNNGSIWNAWVDYNGATSLLEVRWSLSNTRPLLPQLSSTQNLSAILGSPNAFIGFTAGTGSAYNDHDILNWQFVDSFSPINSAVPEPCALIWGLMTSGLLISTRRYR